MNWCTALAVGIEGGENAKAEIGDAIGPDAVSGARFYPYNYLLDTPWEIMDGNNADCGSFSALMKAELDQLGAKGANVMFVYSRHDSWKGLAQSGQNGHEYDTGGRPLYMWFPEWNRYE